MKKAFLFLANGFEEVEALTPIDYLRRAGIDLVTVGVEGKTILSGRKVPVTCDIVLEEALAMEEDLIAVVLPGGLPNGSILAGTEAVKEFAKKTLANGGIVAAICASPALALGPWGLLEGKKYTCYPGMGQDLNTKPQEGERVIRDGNIITACAAGAAEEFSFAIVEAICGKTALNKLKTEVVAR
ncbi:MULTISPECIES: DJ-1 family glyoxalase III [unclassified Treponema]|uniref:DJ-1 family glyoxalase III n=1 Tax=unclassified Treponema TaxID=2638727 RepID=UPI0020A3D990|nr:MULTISPECIES: DJ-1 family glyoxalase III [unclassified Treponema]UTC67403.1 DJ-1/PfpI family protein [Treponema sp. OMZ 789]UTC70131.1 DJ-1/PfpI family protein [Treponema sp. OMZ 790]UTC72846.1 DJ-1/PfpI family protein [Treponema sp. OMZ 791]